MTIDPELGDRERSALDVWEPMTPPPGFADRVLAVRSGRRWLPYAATAIACGAAAAIIAAILSNPGQTLPDAAKVAFGGADANEIDAAVAPISPDATPPIDYEMMPLPPDGYSGWYDDGIPGYDAGRAASDAARLYDSGFWVDGSYVPTPLGENQYDVDVEGGETFTVHSPTDVAYVKFHTAKCKEPIVAEIDHDQSFSASRPLNHIGFGATGASIEAEAGTWYYRMFCESGKSIVANGRFTVIRDEATRKLPGVTTTKQVDPDGKVWSISYQATIPSLEIKRVPGGERFHLVDAKGVDRSTFIKDPTVAAFTVPGSSLRDGSYTFWFDRGGVKVGLSTTITIAFDQTAPQISIEEPTLQALAVDPVTVRLYALPGWSISVDGKQPTSQIDIEPNPTYFSMTTAVKPNHAVAIKARHATRGIHYYVRRLR